MSKKAPYTWRFAVTLDQLCLVGVILYVLITVLVYGQRAAAFEATCRHPQSYFCDGFGNTVVALVEGVLWPIFLPLHTSYLLFKA